MKILPIKANYQTNYNKNQKTNQNNVSFGVVNISSAADVLSKTRILDLYSGILKGKATPLQEGLENAAREMTIRAGESEKVFSEIQKAKEALGLENVDTYATADECRLLMAMRVIRSGESWNKAIGLFLKSSNHTDFEKLLENPDYYKTNGLRKAAKTS